MRINLVCAIVFQVATMRTLYFESVQNKRVSA